MIKNTKSNKISNNGVICPQPNPQAKLKLFCFHHAGGSAGVYRSWVQDLPTKVEMGMIELPGRRKRISEPLQTRLEPLVEDIADAIVPLLNKPFVFFGHSMGGIISFELTRHLRQVYRLNPAHLFISGCRAPQVPPPRPPIHKLLDHQFLQELRSFNGISEEVLAHGELMELLLPILKADFTLLETYHYKPDLLLNCPITALGGLQDQIVPQDHLEAWKEQTTGTFSLRMFGGDHFFIDSARSLVLECLGEKLREIVKGVGG